MDWWTQTTYSVAHPTNACSFRTNVTPLIRENEQAFQQCNIYTWGALLQQQMYPSPCFLWCVCLQVCFLCKYQVNFVRRWIKISWMLVCITFECNVFCRGILWSDECIHYYCCKNENQEISIHNKAFTPCSGIVQQRDPSLQISAAMTRPLHSSSLPSWGVTVNEQWVQPATAWERIQKHLDNFTEGTAWIEKKKRYSISDMRRCWDDRTSGWKRPRM